MDPWYARGSTAISIPFLRRVKEGRLSFWAVSHHWRRPEKLDDGGENVLG